MRDDADASTPRSQYKTYKTDHAKQATKKEKGAVVPLKAEPSLFLHPSYTITRDQPNLPTEDSQGSGVI